MSLDKTYYNEVYTKTGFYVKNNKTFYASSRGKSKKDRNKDELFIDGVMKITGYLDNKEGHSIA